MSDTFPDEFVVIRTSETKVNRDASTKHDHTWTFDFTGCTLEQVAGAACKDLAIRMQSKFRAEPKDWPAGGYTVKVTDMLKGIQSAPMTPSQLKVELETATPERRDALLTQARAMIAKIDAQHEAAKDSS